MKKKKNWEVQGMKKKKELGSPRNEGNKTIKNEKNLRKLWPQEKNRCI